MKTPPFVNTFVGRLTTFEAPVQLPRRRASSSSSTKKRGAQTVSWPHELPSIEQLARAGFYYRPTATEHDNVTCFMCKKSLDGWEAQDDPASEHLLHSPDCVWAMHACIYERRSDPHRQEEHPMSSRMVAARMETFQEGWPHEHKKGWKCKMEKMVEAGWCYDPGTDSDDGVTCFYCGVSLDGWEPKDDPWEEHLKRSPHCYFLAAVRSSAPHEPPLASKRGQKTRTSKNSRLSTQSTLTTFSQATSAEILGGGDDREEDSILTTVTTDSTASMGGKGRKRATRTKAARTTKKKATRSKKETLASGSDVNEDAAADDEVESTQKSQRKNTRRNTKPKEVSQLELLPTESVPASDRPSRSKTKKEQPRLSEDESQLQSELLAAASFVVEDLPRPDKEKDNGADQHLKLDSSIVMLDAPPETTTTQSQKPKGVRKVSKPVAKGIDMAAAPPRGMKRTSEDRAKHAQEGARAGRDDIESNDVEAAVDAEPKSKKPRRSHSQPEETLTRDGREPSVQPPRPAKEPQIPFSSKVMTPSPSPQSSDAENHPPSSRPSLSLSQMRSPISRVPLAHSTPNLLSAKKQPATDNDLQTTCTWQPVDLERIFVQSPSSKAVFGIDSINGKENLSSLEGLPLKEVIKGVEARLTSPEKRMSVEQWIYFNAEKGEQRLKNECERLVGIFETEGGKALRALEGIECYT